jgi:hypothetical protein
MHTLEELKVRGDAAMVETRRIIAEMRMTAAQAHAGASHSAWSSRTPAHVFANGAK